MSCQNRFIDLAPLKQHEPGCYVILEADENENKWEIDIFSLNIDRNCLSGTHRVEGTTDMLNLPS